jgi:hypothetical protein
MISLELNFLLTCLPKKNKCMEKSNLILVKIFLFQWFMVLLVFSLNLSHIFNTKGLNDNLGRSENNDDTNDSWVPSKNIEWKQAKRKSRSRREKIAFEIHFIEQIVKHKGTKRKKNHFQIIFNIVNWMYSWQGNSWKLKA